MFLCHRSNPIICAYVSKHARAKLKCSKKCLKLNLCIAMLLNRKYLPWHRASSSIYRYQHSTEKKRQLQRQRRRKRNEKLPVGTEIVSMAIRRMHTNNECQVCKGETWHRRSHIRTHTQALAEPFTWLQQQRHEFRYKAIQLAQAQPPVGAVNGNDHGITESRPANITEC